MTATAMTTHIRVEQATLQIGAVVSGIDLRRPMSEADMRVLRGALDDYLVLFFRDQDISAEQQLALCEVFAPAVGTSLGQSTDANPHVLPIKRDPTLQPRGTDNQWHTDQSYRSNPPTFVVLRAVDLPPTGGDTCWASMYAAYDALSPRMQQYLEGLVATHDVAASARAVVALGIRGPSAMTEMITEYPPVQHPVIRVNSTTGRKALYVNRNYTVRIEGLPWEESDAILAFLFGHVSNPAFHYRFRWEPGSIAVWDNRWTQHFALFDYSTRRVMNRVSSIGAPVEPVLAG